MVPAPQMGKAFAQLQQAVRTSRKALAQFLLTSREWSWAMPDVKKGIDRMGLAYWYEAAEWRLRIDSRTWTGTDGRGPIELLRSWWDDLWLEEFELEDE